MKRQLTLILNGKGGVGKSFFAIHLVQLMKQQKMSFVAIDSDNENSTLKRFHPESHFVDISSPQEMDEIINNLEQVSTVVVDCRAASTDLFLEHFDEIDAPRVLDSLQARLTVVMPINTDPDSLEQLKVITEQLGSSACYLTIRNLVHGEGFELYGKSSVRQRLLKELGAKEIVLDRLQPWLVEILHRLNLPADLAAKDATVPLLNRQRLQTWQRKFEAQINLVAELLFPKS